jgi:hypothetical protein
MKSHYHGNSIKSCFDDLPLQRKATSPNGEVAFHQTSNSSKCLFIKEEIHQTYTKVVLASNGLMTTFDEVAVAIHFLAQSSSIITSKTYPSMQFFMRNLNLQSEFLYLF